MPSAKTLELISDGDGAVRLGWLAENVLFAHFRGKLDGVSTQYSELITEIFPRRYKARVLCDAMYLDASLRSARFALKPLLESEAAPSLSIQVLTKSRLIAVTASSMALLTRAQLQVISSKREFRELLRGAAVKPQRVNTPVGAQVVRMSIAVSAATPPARRSR